MFPFHNNISHSIIIEARISNASVRLGNFSVYGSHKTLVKFTVDCFVDFVLIFDQFAQIFIQMPFHSVIHSFIIKQTELFDKNLCAKAAHRKVANEQKKNKKMYMI